MSDQPPVLHAPFLVISMSFSVSLAMALLVPSASASAPSSASAHTITPELLGTLISIGRERLPAFEIEYEMGTLGTPKLGVMSYANGEPSVWNPSVRVAHLEGGSPCMTHQYDAHAGIAAEIASSAYVDGWDVKTAHHGGAGDRGAAALGFADFAGDFEFYLGMGGFLAIAHGRPLPYDMVQAIETGGVVVRAEQVFVGGYECYVLDVPMLSDGGLENRHSYYIAPELNFAQVVREDVVANRLAVRRTSSDFIEIATGATYLPLKGDLEDFDRAGQLIDQQMFTVSRNALGEPLIRTGAAVSFALNPPVGSRVTDVETGRTRIVSADDFMHADAVLASSSAVSGVNTKGRSAFSTPLLIAAVRSLGLIGASAWRRRHQILPEKN